MRAARPARPAAKAGWPAIGGWLVVTVLCGMLVLATAAEGYREIYYAEYFDGWQATPGRIVSAKSAVLRRGKYEVEHIVQVFYTYQVGDQIYRGNRIRYGMPIRLEHNWYDPDAVPRRLFPPGQSVPVYYDPRAPEVAVLDKKSLGSGWIWDQKTPLILASIIGPLALLMALRGLWTRLR